MGMDFVPRKKDVEGLHLNWSGYQALADILALLEADVRFMSGVNDGNYIPARVCREWAKKINRALEEDRLRTVWVKNKMYAGGGYDRFVLNKGYPLEPHDVRWVQSVAKFFETCGGCREF